MRVSAKTDYGIRALVALSALEDARGGAVTRDQIGAAQDIPVAFLENILLELKRAGLVRSLRGQAGGFRLARAPDEITLADIIRAIDGPLASVRGIRPEDLAYAEPAGSLRDVWIAVRSSLRVVLERVTLADVLSGHLPDDLAHLLDRPEAWKSH